MTHESEDREESARRRPTVVILSIGDELLAGDVVDTNKAHIAAACRRHGLEVRSARTVRDRRDEIVATLQELTSRRPITSAATQTRGPSDRRMEWAPDLILVTGGLGPTTDDLTAECVAQALGVGLVRDAGWIERLEQIFLTRGRELLEINRKQADLPAGALLLHNPIGSAPGFMVLSRPDREVQASDGKPDGVVIVCMPGVPAEMRPMLAQEVLPRVLAQLAQTHRFAPLWSRTYRVNGLGESTVQARISSVLDELTKESSFADLNVRYRASGYEVSVTLELGLANPAAFGALIAGRLAQLDRAMSEALERSLYGRGTASMAERIVACASAAGITLATAESCTAGLVADALASVPGASACLLGGVVAYHPSVKRDRLDLDAELLARAGVVSEDVARAMASGGAVAIGADLCVAVTGLAGPGGGEHGRPVGTVHFALADRRSGEVLHRHEHLYGDRSMIRTRAVAVALRMIWDRLVSLGVAEVVDLDAQGEVLASVDIRGASLSPSLPRSVS